MNQTSHFGVFAGMCEDCVCPSKMIAQTSYEGWSMRCFFLFLKYLDEVLLLRWLPNVND